MSALDVRSNSAVMKRAEQLKRWEESDTNRSPASPRPEHGRKIKFSSGCVFLAACLSSDKEEVLKLLENGADINTANVDGLTALHQACIDDNLDMVEFLVEHGADINRQDNEGWTPLHATASCGFVSIARFLVENGADVAAVNSDGDLALDLAIDIQNMGMIEYMQQVINEHKVDCEKARQAEEQLMLADAKKWLRSDASEVDRPHAKTGATALHVAAAKGYTKVISLLLAGRANVDKQDNDGWTPLHAAAHWGQKEAAEMLVDAMADMEIRNYAGQTCMEVADRKMIKTLEELRAKSKRSIKRRPSSQIRISDASEHHIENLAPKIFRTELKNNLNNEENKNLTKSATTVTVTVSPTSTTTATTTTATNIKSLNENEQKQEQQQQAAKVTTTETCNISGTKATITTTTTTSPDVIEATFTIPKSAMNIPPVAAAINSNAMVVENEDAPWRRNNLVQRVRLMDTITNKDTSEISDVVLRRSQSFDKDKKKPFMPQRTALSLALNSASVANATVTIPATNTTATTSTTTTTTTTSTQSGTTTTTTTTPQRRSFAPPARNEESETQRKAHAKRVRESRRSTQGVTLDEIKSAEELVKKSNSTTATATTTTTNSSNNNLSTTATTATTTTTLTTTKKEDTSNVEASFTPTNNSKIILSAPAVIVAAQRNSLERPKNANVDNSVTDPSAFVSKRFSNSIAATNIAEQDKDNDKENDNRTTLTTQAVLQRRRKPKRRSTGVVHIDMDDLDPERSDGTNDAEEKDDEVKSDEGMIDYKALWEAEKLEKEKLKQQVDKKDEELVQLKATIERNASAANAKNSISELEKRERRAMERKLSEMEEELKQLELYKTENQRLKEENGALIRVISKLSK